MAGFTAADAARWVSRAIERPVDVVIANTGRPSKETLMRYAAEQKEPLELGALDDRIELVTGPFWNTAIARHDRRRLSFAVWSVLVAVHAARGGRRSLMARAGDAGARARRTSVARRDRHLPHDGHHGIAAVDVLPFDHQPDDARRIARRRHEHRPFTLADAHDLPLAVLVRRGLDAVRRTSP